MRRIGLKCLGVLLACVVFPACTCTNNQTGGKRFACTNNADCIEGFVCRGGECRDQSQPQTACLPTDPPRSCTINGTNTCQQTCQPDGGLSPCQPITGGPFDSNPQNCGECGVSCGSTAGLLCIASRCTCINDLDCPTGHRCNQGGVCLLDTDSCVGVRCPTGEVCRNGLCGTEPCATGAQPGEVCDLVTGNLRPIDPCKLPGRCPDGGICEGDPKPPGSACDDGVACTHTDVCTNGTCAGTTYSCGSPGACQLSVACAGDGGCTAVPQIDGTSCDDNNPCTLNDSCASGACTGSSYTCTPGACDQSSVCNGDGGCTTTPKAAGASCNDTNDCTFTDVCDGDGGCAGTGYSCPAPTTCQAAVACNGDGGCLFSNKDAGASCDDGQACTIGDVCDSNQNCAGVAGTTYLDADGDGRGDSNIPQSVCPTDGGWVAIGGDCNDSDPDVAYVGTNLVRDLDNDGYTTGSPGIVCVGTSQTINGRVYYRDTAGAYTWLAAGDSIGTDCLDSDGDVFVSMVNMAVDSDTDGYYVGSPATMCVGAASTINGRTYYANTAGAFTVLATATALGGGECNDADVDVYRSINSLGSDVDQDGYLATSPAVGAQCVGDTSVVSGRTYYRTVAGAYTWLAAPGLGTDCNDTNPGILGATPWYVDGDGDTFGAGAVTNACTQPGASYVANNSDCNDATSNVFQTVTSLVTDTDQDGYSTGAAASQCVGTTTAVGGRTYYRNATGGFSWLPSGSSLGTDCLDSNVNIFTNVASSATDGDNDGYYTGSLATNCAGSSSVINGRTYYRNSGGTFTFIAAGTLGGSDCNDGDPDVFQTVANLGADADNDGYLALVPAVGSQCVGGTSVINTRTYYRDLAGAFSWLTAPGLGNDCNDTDGSTINPPNWRFDTDGDGYGGATTQVSCASPGVGWVLSALDCNDGDSDIFQTVANMATDTDQDGYITGAGSSQCVGNTSLVGGRTYYRDAAGAYSLLSTGQSLGTDCLEANGNVFVNLASSATDADNDGYYVGALATNCVGSTSVINGRTYYRNSGGTFTFIAAGALGANDCLDSDLDVFQNVANLGADTDNDGYLATSPAVGTQCVGGTSVINGRTYYRNTVGTFTWLTSPGLGSDCNDTTNTITGPTNYYVDADGDGFGAGGATVACTAPVGQVPNNSDCNDASGNVYQNVASLVTDVDHDSYRTAAAASTQCVGPTAIFNGRSYYRAVGGTYPWLASGSSPGVDCDDNNASTGSAPTWYLDGDGDGRGTGTGITQCSSPGAGYVTLGNDCLDTNGNIYQNIGNLVPDLDNDGYTTGVGATQCVGGSTTINGRLYYRASGGAYTWLNALNSLGTDCNASDGDVFQNVSNLLQDFDNDGYPPIDNPATQCVGSSTFVSGRQYYVGTSGTPDWLVKNDCIGRQGNSCPQLDCYDSNGNARLGQTLYFTVNRGDGSFDYDCSGGISANTSGTYCASTSTTTTYSDGACTVSAGSGSICNTPTAYSLPGACGKNLSAGTTTFIISGVCTSATRASATVVGCR